MQNTTPPNWTDPRKSGELHTVSNISYCTAVYSLKGFKNHIFQLAKLI